MRLHMRSYKNSDLKAMQALLRGVPSELRTYPSASELPEILDPAASGTPNNTVVWVDNAGQVHGFAIIDLYDNLHYFILPEMITDVLEEELEGWAIARGQLIAASQNRPVVLEASVRDHESKKKHFLLQHGFTPYGEQTLRMSRSLLDPYPELSLPAGFILRPLAGEGEVDAYVTAHRLAYGTEMMTREMRLAIMRQPYYKPDLDLVIEAPQGSLAAFCVCSIYEEENLEEGLLEGEISIVGVHPDYRKCGLGMAAVLSGLNALRQQGMETAYLSVASGNEAALRLYQGAGFRVKWATDWYQREVKGCTKR